jgi:MoxR-like ATPase
MTELTKTKSQVIATDIAALLNARYPLLWINTKEEARVEQYLAAAAKAARYAPHTWDAAQGAVNIDGTPVVEPAVIDIDATLDMIRDRATEGNERDVWIMRDLAPWLGNDPLRAQITRKLRNITRLFPPNERAQPIIVLSAGGEIPAELSGHATVLDWPMPDRIEIGEILDKAVAPYTEKQIEKPGNGIREAAIDAAMGLNGADAAAFYAKSLVQNRKIDPVSVGKEKKRIIAKQKGLEWYDPLPGGLDAVGGLDILKGWLIGRSTAFTPAAKAYGLPAPKGVFLIGISGCGKTYTAKAIATTWERPLIRWDINAGKDALVGSSEENFRNAQKTIEAAGPCVVFVDEIEKTMQGATSGSSDGGVSADILGSFLTWMQERTTEAFVVATANDVSALPPELMRKGRFDEVFFLDLPNATEREQILAATLKQYKRDVKAIDLAAVADETKDFTGAEIAALVPEAMFAAFNDGARPLETKDLITVAKSVVKLATTAAEKIADLRKWCRGRARNASTPEDAKRASEALLIDLDERRK